MGQATFLLSHIILSNFVSNQIGLAFSGLLHDLKIQGLMSKFWTSLRPDSSLTKDMFAIFQKGTEISESMVSHQSPFLVSHVYVWFAANGST